MLGDIIINISESETLKELYNQVALLFPASDYILQVEDDLCTENGIPLA